MLNVLLTCAGRRNYLVNYFREALAGCGALYAADASEQAPAMKAADRAFRLPRVDERGYCDALLRLCEENDIRIVFSLNDLELPVLSAERERFAQHGIKIVVSSPEVIRVCFDKLETARFLLRNDIPAPATFCDLASAHRAIEEGALRFPVFIKPRWGTASVGLEIAERASELDLAVESTRRRIRTSVIADVSARDGEQSVLIQQMIRGAEYGLDVVNNLDAQYVTTLAKKKLAMRAGETDRAVTVADDRLSAIGRRLGESLGHVANLDVDVLEQDNQLYVLELNPRFGGGYPFSHEAGANLPAAILAWARGENPDAAWLSCRPGEVFAKCDYLVRVG